jgi:cysteine desulfurase/selenocysteine lyase
MLSTEVLMTLNIEKIRNDFPQVTTPFEGNIITYLDNAATTLKPKSVVELVETYYLKECANIHRGIHTLSEVSTDKYEHTRNLLKDFINAKKREEVIFTKGTTESINLVARTWGEKNLKAGDEILISHLEHHSNIVPWQLLCEKTGAKLVACPVNDAGEILIEEYKKLLNEKTKLVSMLYISNSLGTINPVSELIKLAHDAGALFLLDAAQAIAHLNCDVQALDCDFMAFSGHKMFGPTGVGVLYGKEAILEQMPPFIGGGDMIDQVRLDKTTYNSLPYKFEAGTPNIAGVIGLAPAIDYINDLGLDQIFTYEHKLLEYATEKMSDIKGLRIIGTAKEKASVVSFVMDGLHPHDIGTLTSKDHLAIRTGHHCTQPLMERMCVPATARASFSIYNTTEDIDKLVKSLNKIVDLFS